MPTIRKRGSKYQAQVRVRRDGVIVYQTSASFSSKRQAEQWGHAVEARIAKLGIEDLRLHDLRHEGISRLFEAGLQIQEVALISGHVSWAALKRYTHIKPLDVLEKLNARS